MNNPLRRLVEAWNQRFGQSSGSTSPPGTTLTSKPSVPLSEVMELYERDPACKSAVDLLTRAVITDYYTTAEAEFERAKEAADDFSAELNLDGILLNAGTYFIACGNDFWLKKPPNGFTELVHVPIQAIDPNVKMLMLDEANGFKIPYKVANWKLARNYGGVEIKPEAMLHFGINALENNAFGTGLLQVLIHRLTLYGFTRPAYAEMKAKIEKIMPKIFEKYAGPDVLAQLEGAKEPTIQKFETAIRSRPEEGQWLFFGGKNANLFPVMIDPRARFEYYVDHIVNQFYLGLETPLPRLFSTPGFTEASSNAALSLQDILVRPLQRYVKRLVEREIFWPVVRRAGYDPLKVKVRLHWGMPEVPEVKLADLIELAKIGATTGTQIIRPDELRKNLAKFGIELFEPQKSSESSASQ